MIPVLDILQGIPVLGFLPGLVLGMVALFPHSNVGLELACVVMIFTGQVWNMTFSFYGSLRAIPAELREAARVYRFGWWKRFRTVEVPSAMIGLVWNSMMSMAGGWFFLTVNEAFTLGDHDFRLPGIGSYMSVAIDRGDARAMAGAVGRDDRHDRRRRPARLAARRWRGRRSSRSRRPRRRRTRRRSWVLDLLRRSRMLAWIERQRGAGCSRASSRRRTRAPGGDARRRCGADRSVARVGRSRSRRLGCSPAVGRRAPVALLAAR